MNLTIEIDDSLSPLLEGVRESFESGDLRVRIQAAMAHTFATVVNHNFGGEGEDRPHDWRILSERYALAYKDGDRTPTLILDGNLKASIEIDDQSIDAASVYTNNPYAVAQQFGDATTNLPARPFFPMTEDGQVTEYTAEKCVQAARSELSRFFNETLG